MKSASILAGDCVATSLRKDKPHVYQSLHPTFKSANLNAIKTSISVTLNSQPPLPSPLSIHNQPTYVHINSKPPRLCLIRGSPSNQVHAYMHAGNIPESQLQRLRSPGWARKHEQSRWGTVLPHISGRNPFGQERRARIRAMRSL